MVGTVHRKSSLCAGALKSGSPRARGSAPGLHAGALCFVVAFGVAQARAAEIRVEAKADGPATIVLEGPITKADLPGMERAVEEARRKAPKRNIVLSLNSPGGAHFEGLRIGLLLRREGIGTLLPPGAGCASACSSIFFGGFDATTGKPNRVAYETARLGVHRMVRTEGRREPTPEETKRVEHAAQKYFDEAGVPARIQAKVFETPPNELYVLTRADMIESGIAILPVPPGATAGIAPGPKP
jgi:hypothetical protein